jgi:RNA polymerase sigma-70 factor (ECF subfamily)
MDSDPKADARVVTDQARGAADAVYRSESRQIFATLVRLLSDFDLA